MGRTCLCSARLSCNKRPGVLALGAFCLTSFHIFASALASLRAIFYSSLEDFAIPLNYYCGAAGNTRWSTADNSFRRT